MNKAKPTETGAIHKVLNINISEIRLMITMWPASILANKRIINAIGFENMPTISTGIIIGNNHHGLGEKICFHYYLLPLRLINKNMINASVKVTAILPVKL